MEFREIHPKNHMGYEMKEKNEIGELKLPELRFSAELQNQSTSVVLLPYPDGII